MTTDYQVYYDPVNDIIFLAKGSVIFEHDTHFIAQMGNWFDGLVYVGEFEDLHDY
jgi:hypothetical protein